MCTQCVRQPTVSGEVALRWGITDRVTAVSLSLRGRVCLCVCVCGVFVCIDPPVFNPVWKRLHTGSPKAVRLCRLRLSACPQVLAATPNASLGHFSCDAKLRELRGCHEKCGMCGCIRPSGNCPITALPLKMYGKLLWKTKYLQANESLAKFAPVFVHP